MAPRVLRVPVHIEEIIRALHPETKRKVRAALTSVVADPTGLGRVVHGRGNRVKRIVEHRDATDEEREIHEINTSVYCFKRSLLAPALRRLSPENSQGEYYLTDVVSVLYEAGYNVISHIVADPAEAAGVNDRIQLAAAEAELRRRTNIRLMAQGVTMLDPAHTYIDATVQNKLLRGKNGRFGADCERWPTGNANTGWVHSACQADHYCQRHASGGTDGDCVPFAEGPTETHAGKLARATNGGDSCLDAFPDLTVGTPCGERSFVK